MCGIAGLIATGVREVPQWKGMFLHRGRDHEGVFADGSVFLQHNRLAIIDTSPRGNQPMHNEDATLTLICNGEIYNAPALRQELSGRGHRFVSDADIEVILHLYEELGPAMLPRLRGMFAFALYDRRRGEVLLARDAFGIKPLVYARLRQGRAVAFASELRAFSLLPDFHREPDADALALYGQLNYIPAPLTAWKGARKVLPGEYLVFALDGRLLRQERWYDLLAEVRRPLSSSRSAVRDTAAVIDESVRCHLLADVPVGAFLSGGIDSGLVAALACRHSRQKMRTFTVTFPDAPYYDESARAASSAAMLGTRHQELPVTAAEAAEVMEEMIAHLDEPFADSSLIAYALAAKKAREHVKVILSGDGADELFAGYAKYQGMRLAGYGRWFALPLRLAANLPFASERSHAWGDRLRKARKLSTILDDDELQRCCRSMTVTQDLPAQLCTMLAPLYDRAVAAGLQGLDRWLYLDSCFVLPYDMLAKVDCASMRYNLEVRVPFVDTRVAAQAFALAPDLKLRGFVRKWVLRRISRGCLPASVLNGPKKGFGIPLGQWMREGMRRSFNDTFCQAASDRVPFVDHRRTAELFREHCAGRQDAFWELWNRYVFLRWWRQCR